MGKNIVVVGAGTMGNGIAHVFAQNGHTVTIVDLDQGRLDNALGVISKNLDRMIKKEVLTTSDKTETLMRIETATQLETCLDEADLVIEAVSEQRDLKLSIFKTLSDHTRESCILASNTSSISITELASVVVHPERVIGMHFMNPVPVMKLIEVIKGYSTSDHTTHEIISLGKSLQKIPVEVNDYPGFISNRILMPMINEAIYALHEGVATAKAIDDIMKLGMAHPMGPLQLADFIGLDVCLSILRVLQQGYGLPKYAPCPLLVSMVSAGKLGKKSGEGFYTYH